MSKEKLVITLLCINVFLLSASSTLVLPFLPLYLQELNTDNSALNFYTALAYSSTYAVSIVISPLWGHFADKYGKKLMLTFVFILLALSYLFAYLSTNAIQLCLSRAFQGLACGIIPAFLSLVSCIAKEQKAGIYMGYMQSGILLGTLLGMSSIAKKMLQPLFTTIRQIPIMAWIPLLILWCGIGEGSKVVIIFIASVFPILINTQAGISSPPDSLLEVAQLFKLSKFNTFLRVYLPHALSGIQTGLKLGLGVSWMAVVAAELIASTSGIGYTRSYARTLMQSNVVILCMIVVGLIGILMDKVISLIFSLATPWERVNNKR